MKIRLSILICAVLASIAIAAETLTNKSIVDLQQLGLGDAVIIEKIKTSSCNFDTSTDALKKLKDAGVSPQVLAAMVGAGAATLGDVNDPSALHEPGIYYYADVGGKKTMSKVEPKPYSGTKSGTAFFAAYGGTAKQRAVLAGAHAETQCSESRPVFYFYFEKAHSGLSYTGAPATPDDFVISQMEIREKDNTRRVVIGKFGAYSGTSSGADKKSTREFTSEKVGAGIYKVSIAQDLKAGEYCFFQPLVGGGVAVYGFGIK